jgi:hypothetical protein
MKTSILAALILLTGFAGCRGSSSRSALIGRYELQGQDRWGRRAFTGSILLTSIDQKIFKGRCTIEREKDTQEGLVDQTPLCEASVDGKKVTIDLAPSMDDGGLLFEGEYDGTQIRGVWMFDSHAGSQPQGKFVAVKKGPRIFRNTFSFFLLTFYFL